MTGAIVGELERLGRLHEKGLLTAGEFAQMKSRLISDKAEASVSGSSRPSTRLRRARVSSFRCRAAWCSPIGHRVAARELAEASVVG